jgi:hypothetical protein
MTARGPHILRTACPTAEDLAALLDNAVDAVERSSLTAHLATCERCYTVFAAAAAFLSDPAQAACTGSIPQPLPSSPTFSFPPRRARARWLAAAAVLAAAVAIPVYRERSISPRMVVADLVAPLASHLPTEHFLLDRPAMRGSQQQSSVLSPLPSFLVGALEVDLRLRLAGGAVERSSRIVARIGELLREVDFMEAAGAAYQDESARLTSAGALRRFAAGAAAREEALESDTSLLLPDWVAFGKWTEAGRLAAAARSSAFFEARRNRRYLAFLLRGRLVPLDPWSKSTLREIASRWDRDRFTLADLAALETAFGKLIAITDTELRRGGATPAD